jgi:radical SAM protein (TIGR04043 family)
VEAAVRSELAVRGVRASARVRRRGGAGPSDDGHLLVGGRQAALPLCNDSPFEVVGGRLTRDGEPLDIEVEPVARPRFYDLETAEGVPYDQIARLHGEHVLATTVVQTCVRYRDEDTRCRFCTIEESLRSGATVQVKQPGELAEVAEAAVRLDGVRQLVMTTGTSNGSDRGARHLARCAAAVREVVPGLPIQAQCEPPREPGVLEGLREAGVTALGIHVESLDEDVRRRWTPGKAEVSVAGYEAAWREAVRVFGRNRVSTYVLVGLGEDPEELVAGAERLVSMGVYPFVVPYRPQAGSLAARDGVPPPSAEVLEEVTTRVAAALQAGGMRGVDQGAGCAACGACSALAAAGG